MGPTVNILVYIGTIKHPRDIHSFPELLHTFQLCQLAVEKKAEVDSMLEVLQTKQNELQSHQHLYWMLKGKKHKAIPKEEFATPKTASKKETWDTDTTTEKENWDTASEKENSEIYIEDDTDIDLISSASENIPQKVDIACVGHLHINTRRGVPGGLYD